MVQENVRTPFWGFLIDKTHGSSLAHKLNHDDLSVSEQDVPPLIDPRHTYSDQSSYCIRNPVIPVEHAEAGELLEESDGEGYS